MACSPPTPQGISTLPPDSPNYNMSHKNQGKVIVFNHFVVEGEDDRLGTHKDVQRINKTFTNLRFEVIQHNDLKLSQIREIIEKCTFV